jgi:hypothetical protein
MIRAHSPEAGNSPQEHGAEPVEVQDRPPGAKQQRRAGRTSGRRTTAEVTVPAGSSWRPLIAPRREAAAPGQPLWRPAHGGGGDSRVGYVLGMWS